MKKEINNEKDPLDRHKLSIEEYMVDGEKIETILRLRNMKMSVSNMRLFIDRGTSIRDVVYSHISSIAYRYKGWNPWMVVTGALVGVSSIVLRTYVDFFDEFEREWTTLLTILFLGGVILVMLGLIYKEEFMEIDVVGMNRPITIGNKGFGRVSGIEHLFRIVREKVDF